MNKKNKKGVKLRDRIPGRRGKQKITTKGGVTECSKGRVGVEGGGRREKQNEVYT